MRTFREPTSPATREQLSLIHLGKSRLHMAEDDYRALLHRCAGVDSAKKLDQTGVDAVIREFARLGFVAVSQGKRYGARDGMASEAQIQRIRSRWRSYTGTDDEVGLRTWLQNHWGVADLRFIDAKLANSIIGASENMYAWRKDHPRKRGMAEG
jgi:hypothetical protein